MTEGHSALGGSGAYRWMPCPGSVLMAQGHEDPESEYAAEGTAAHALAAHCLNSNMDAWEYIGALVVDGEIEGAVSDYDLLRKQAAAGFLTAIDVDKDMADAVQEYLDAVRLEYPDRNQGNTWVERLFHCPGIHELMWGRADLAHLEVYRADKKLTEHVSIRPDMRLHVRDYKHGAGIVVGVERNPQLMYYGVAMLEDLGLWDVVDEVVLWVDQPRGYMNSPRSWTVSVEELARWRDEVLVPAMNLAEWVLGNDQLTHEDLLSLNLLNSGEHCRFCPARYAACPRLAADMEELREMTEALAAKGGAPKMTTEWIGRFLTLFEVAKITQKAAREVGFMRAQDGHEVPGWKLVKAKSNREWKDGSPLQEKFGDDALEPKKLKSPAKVEKLPGGKAFAAEYAFKPDTGMQLVADGDARAEAGPKGRAMFEPVEVKPKKTRKK